MGKEKAIKKEKIVKKTIEETIHTLANIIVDRLIEEQTNFPDSAENKTI